MKFDYSINNQSYIDIDWFGIDEKGYVVHIASGGGLLPKSVSANAEEVGIIRLFVNSLLGEGGYKINPLLSEVIQFNKTDEREMYLNDFVLMAKKGLYSFDKSEPSYFENNEYHLVAIPDTPLKFEDLPNDIRALIKKTHIPNQVVNVKSLNVMEIL